MKIYKFGIAFLLVLLMASFTLAVEAEPTREQIEQHIAANLDKVDLSQAPKMLKFVLGKPKVNIEVANLDETTSVYGFKITGEKIEEFKVGGLEKPNYIIKISEATIMKLVEGENPGEKVGEFYANGEIVIEPQTFGSKIKFWFAKKFMNRFLN